VLAAAAAGHVVAMAYRHRVQGVTAAAVLVAQTPEMESQEQLTRAVAVAAQVVTIRILGLVVAAVQVLSSSATHFNRRN
jgi:hypothetical protein